MTMTTTQTTWIIEAHTQGARWPVATGISSRHAADRVLEAIVAKDGLTAADSSGRHVPVTFGIREAD